MPHVPCASGQAAWKGVRGMSTLFELRADLEDVINNLEDMEADEGLVQAAIAEYLDCTGPVLRAKVDGYCALLKSYEAQGRARAYEAKRLSELASADRNRGETLKKRLYEFFVACKIPKFDTDRYHCSVRGNGGLQPLTAPEDPAKVPTEYTKVICLVDKDAIREALAKGVEIEGCRLEERGTHLEIR
jgi:hypothetical protein